MKVDQRRLVDFKRKVNAVLNRLDLPISIYAATARDQYRKPRVGMWREMLGDHGLTAVDSLDLDNSIFVGDAGGRSGGSSGKVPKDHACSDR